jgi:hypothetical protein
MPPQERALIIGEPPTSTPLKRYCPDVGRSRQPITFIAVDFPDPLGPMIATNSPGVMSISTPSSARTSAAPDP